MLRIVAVACLCGFTACAALADDASKEAKIRKLFELQGLTAMFDEQVEAARTQSTRTADRTMAQVRNQFDLPPQYEERAQAAYRKLVDTGLKFPSSSEVVEFLIKSYAPKVSEEDVDASLAYFSSEVAKRNLAASQDAAREASAFVSERTRGQVQNATQVFAADLTAVIKECNCARKPAAPPK